MPRSVNPAPDEPRLARVAAQIADPSRARMLSYLLSGEYASAGELALAASVTPATASGHLAKLLDAGFVACEQRGRHTEGRAVLPVAFLDPLEIEFVGAVKGIGNFTGAAEIGVHAARHDGGQPFFCSAVAKAPGG